MISMKLHSLDKSTVCSNLGHIIVMPTILQRYRVDMIHNFFHILFSEKNKIFMFFLTTHHEPDVDIESNFWDDVFRKMCRLNDDMRVVRTSAFSIQKARGASDGSEKYRHHHHHWIFSHFYGYTLFILVSASSSRAEKNDGRRGKVECESETHDLLDFPPLQPVFFQRWIVCNFIQLQIAFINFSYQHAYDMERLWKKGDDTQWEFAYIFPHSEKYTLSAEKCLAIIISNIDSTKSGSVLPPAQFSRPSCDRMTKFAQRLW